MFSSFKSDNLIISVEKENKFYQTDLRTVYQFKNENISITSTCTTKCYFKTEKIENKSLY